MLALLLGVALVAQAVVAAIENWNSNTSISGATGLVIQGGAGLLGFSLLISAMRVLTDPEETLDTKAVNDADNEQALAPVLSYDDLRKLELQQGAIQEYLRDNGEVSITKVSKLLKITEQKAELLLDAMAAKALVEYDDKKRAFRLR